MRLLREISKRDFTNPVITLCFKEAVHKNGFGTDYPALGVVRRDRNQSPGFRAGR